MARILGQELLTWRRFAAGTRGEDGRFTSGATTTSTLYAGVQPATEDDLQLLPEGERARRAKKLYTRTALRVASVDGQTLADQVSIDGEWWEVHAVGPQRSVIRHTKAIVIAVQEADEE